jgi:hypothetical protein
MANLHAVVVALAAWSAAALVLWWPRAGAAWRRGVAVLSSAAGLASLLVAVNAEGLRESPAVAVSLLGTRYVTLTTSAGAGVPYYVLTAVLLLLGLLGLAAGDGPARALSRRWLTWAVVLGVGTTLLRFLLEKAAAPTAWVEAASLTWTAPVVGAFFGWSLRTESRRFAWIVPALAGYALAVRAAVLGLMTAATTLRLGSHYDVSPITLIHHPWSGRHVAFAAGSLEQWLMLAAVPQLLAWPLFTVAMGLGGGALGWLAGRSAVRARPRGASGAAPPAGAD